MNAGEPNAVTAPQFKLAARGFATLFWGLALSLLLATGFLNVQVLSRSPLPAYVVGLAVALTGAALLRRVGPITPQWSRKSSHLLIAALLQVYFVPFVMWWQKLPHVSIFAANLGAAIIAAVWALRLISVLVIEISLATQDRTLYIEARIVAWLAGSLLLLVVLAAVIVLGTRYLPSQNWPAIIFHRAWIYWLRALLLMPVMLTLALCWTSKEHCLTGAYRMGRLAA
jgi:hypothetical protein